MKTVTIMDRSPMLQQMLGELELKPAETAMVTVDMHRGHLDLDIATMPTSAADAERVLRNGKAALDFARSLEIPVIHAVLTYRSLPGIGSEGMTAPFWAAISKVTNDRDRLTPGRRSTVNEHNLIGSPGTEVMPELLAPGDFLIDSKKRLDCFFGTDLDLLLRNLGVRNVCLLGINTNTCVLNTAFSAHNRNYRAVVLADCVASMYGDDLHVLALENIQRCLGWVITNEQFRSKLGAPG
jgi:nicotinamidase-related amidase